MIRPMDKRLAWRAALATLAVTSAATLAAPAARAEGEGVIARQTWSFAGPFGRFDKAQLQRGFKVYKEVCANCHSMRLLRYRNLGEEGGPGFTEGQVKTLAAEAEVVDGFDDTGAPKKRPGRPADAFKAPFPNDEAARAANGGALPPDLSLMARAREAADEATFPLWRWIVEIATTYQEGGADYTHALLTGFADKAPPFKTTDNGLHLVEIPEAEAKPDSPRCATVSKGEEGKPDVCNPVVKGLYFNHAFPGHQIAMPPPLTDTQVEYTDGTPATVDQYARDVSAFLAWAAEPYLEQRKQAGIGVMFYVVLLAGLMYLAKRQLWSRLH